jgi:hypothetical protein
LKIDEKNKEEEKFNSLSQSKLKVGLICNTTTKTTTTTTITTRERKKNYIKKREITTTTKNIFRIYLSN